MLNNIKINKTILSSIQVFKYIYKPFIVTEIQGVKSQVTITSTIYVNLDSSVICHSARQFVKGERSLFHHYHRNNQAVEFCNVCLSTTALLISTTISSMLIIVEFEFSKYACCLTISPHKQQRSIYILSSICDGGFFSSAELSICLLS